jgi:hypothetical protein
MTERRRSGVLGRGSFIPGMKAMRSTLAASILARKRSAGRMRASKWAWLSMITEGDAIAPTG